MTDHLAAAVPRERREAIGDRYKAAVSAAWDAPEASRPVPYSLTPAGEREASGGGAAAGTSAARQRICAQAAAGRDAAQIRAEHEDLAAELLSGDLGPEGRAYAQAYRDEADSLMRELEEETDGRPGAIPREHAVRVIRGLRIEPQPEQDTEADLEAGG